VLIIMSGLESLKSHLEQDVAHSLVSETQKLVLAFGKPYVGIRRPRGFRIGRRKKCFLNAALAVCDPDREEFYPTLSYVEGYAALPGMPPFHHAWVALDDQHAVELTVKDNPLDMIFFGVSFSRSEVMELLLEDPVTGFLSHPIRSAVIDLVHQKKVGRAPA
jgi:hypothetical protein